MNMYISAFRVGKLLPFRKESMGGPAMLSKGDRRSVRYVFHKSQIVRQAAAVGTKCGREDIATRVGKELGNETVVRFDYIFEFTRTQWHLSDRAKAIT